MRQRKIDGTAANRIAMSIDGYVESVWRIDIVTEFVVNVRSIGWIGSAVIEHIVGNIAGRILVAIRGRVVCD